MFEIYCDRCGELKRDSSGTLTPEEFAKWMKEYSERTFEFGGLTFDDPEGSHYDMDALMCTVLTDLGYGEGIDIFKKTKKWYS